MAPVLPQANKGRQNEGECEQVLRSDAWCFEVGVGREVENDYRRYQLAISKCNARHST
jgi:hypothetical protein